MRTSAALAAAAAAFLLALAPGRADAAFVFTLTQVGGNVVVTGSGTLNTTALTLSSNANTSAQTYCSYAILFAGPTNFVPCSVYNGGGLTGPANFGTGSGTANAGTGNLVGIDGFDRNLYVPQGYTSGTALSDTDTYTGQTFASLGFTPGTYTYTWGSVADGDFDSLTVTSVVPEPGTWLGGAALALAALRRRVARTA